MMHLDTHVVVWLYQGQVERIPRPLRDALGQVRPWICPMVRLELQLLYEIGRLTVPGGEILEQLRALAGLRMAEGPCARVLAIAATLAWTRDPFDRLIAAHALADDVPLLTRDRTLLAHCAVATWDTGSPPAGP